MMAVRRRSTRIFGALISTVACFATVVLSARAYGQHPVTGGHIAGGRVSHPPVHPHSFHPNYHPPAAAKPQASASAGKPVQPPNSTVQGTKVGEGLPQGGAGQGGQGGAAGGEGNGTAARPTVPQPPSRAWQKLPEGADEKDRPPAGQCRVWLHGVPASSQPAATSCGQARKNMTPGSSLIFGDDHPSTVQSSVAHPPE
jgi:hypothetical protein